MQELPAISICVYDPIGKQTGETYPADSKWFPGRRGTLDLGSNPEMNASQTDDAAFVEELKLDPPRYKNLADNLRRARAGSQEILSLGALQQRIKDAVPTAKFAIDVLERMALKLRYHLRRNRVIDEVQDVLLYSCLTREEAKLNRSEFDVFYSGEASTVSKGKRTPRQFKQCLGCQKRFLAKRADNLTCSPKCRQRVVRSATMSQISKITRLKAA